MDSSGDGDGGGDRRVLGRRAVSQPALTPSPASTSGSASEPNNKTTGTKNSRKKKGAQRSASSSQLGSSSSSSSSSSLARALRTVDTSGLELTESVAEGEHAQLQIDLEVEDDCLQQMRARDDVAENPLSEFWMRVCLRVKGYDVPRAAASLNAYAAWRDDYEINQRPLHTDEQLLALVRHGVVEAPCFLDRIGHRVLMIRMARADPSRWTPQDAVRCVHVAVEYAFLRYPLAHRCGLAFMIDMRNISTSNMDIRVPHALLGALSNNLPLRFGAVYLINPPLFMRVALNLVKVFLKRKLQRRIHIVKGDVCDDDGILKYFDRRQLPVDMNGACVYDHDAYCSLVEAIHTHYPTPERFLKVSSFNRHPPPTTFQGGGGDDRGDGAWDDGDDRGDAGGDGSDEETQRDAPSSGDERGEITHASNDQRDQQQQEKQQGSDAAEGDEEGVQCIQQHVAQTPLSHTQHQHTLV